MSRAHPDHQMDVPISLAVYHQLLGGSCDSGYKKEYWEIAADAIDEWVRRHNPDAIPAAATRGYQWKSLFLPDGTLLRTVFGGKNYHCLVDNDQISYNGTSVSPSGFVNAVGGIRRNAWRSIWILLPDNKEWKLADTLRIRPRTPRGRKSVCAAPCAPAMQSGIGSTMTMVAPEADQTQPLAINGALESGTQRAPEDNVPPAPPDAAGHRRQQLPGPMRSAPHGQSETDRRARRDDPIAILLREELLPLLIRLCGLHDHARNMPRAVTHGADARSWRYQVKPASTP